MANWHKQFKSCGENVEIAPDAFFEHPEVMEVGNNVRFMRGFHMVGKPERCSIADHVTFMPFCFIQGFPGNFEIGHHVDFYPYTYFSLGDWPTSFLTIGHHSHFAPGCVLYGWGGLTIGNYCNIATHTVFATVGHHEEITDRPMALAGEKAGPITLEEDVWIAANCTVTANTRIAKGCVIGANAVVTHDTEPMGVYVGVPAKRLRDRDSKTESPPA